MNKLKNKETHKPPCNCRIKEECPIDGNCNWENILYQANIFPKEGNFNEKIYIRVSSLKWKIRYYNYIQPFNNPLLKNQTDSSKYYWKLQDQRLTLRINWTIIENSLQQEVYMVDAIYD